MSTLADIILKRLRTSGDWMTRTEIAKAIDRTNSVLNPHDLAVLRQLVKDGKIKVQQKAIGVAKWRFRYRAVK